MICSVVLASGIQQTESVVHIHVSTLRFFPPVDHYRVLSRLPFPPSGDLPDSGIELEAPTLWADTLWIETVEAFNLSLVQSLSHVQLFVTPWTAARQASLSITNSRSLLRLTFIELVMPSNHLILCRPLLLPPSIFPSIRIFSRESVLSIK